MESGTGSTHHNIDNRANHLQMLACLGQQLIGDKRIPFGFHNRALPHFSQYDYSTMGRGFVGNSYMSGLTPQEFFFHSMHGREDLIDKLSTPTETGSLLYKLVKAMEDLCVQYDGTVRNSRGEVMQFVYGEDGVDAPFVERQTFDSLRLSNRAFRDMYHFIPRDFGEGYIIEEEFQQLKADRKQLRKEFMTNGGSTLYMPINIKRLIWNAQTLFHVDMSRPSDLHPAFVIFRVKGLLSRLAGNTETHTTLLLFGILVRSLLAAKRVIEEYHLSEPAFTWLLEEIEGIFRQATVHPGEMVGVIAAQSIGEPVGKQVLLPVFFYAGVSSKKVTLGLPRLKELLYIAKQLRNPFMTVYLKGHCSTDSEMAKSAQRTIEHLTLRMVIVSTEIIYDPAPQNTVVEEDKEFVEAYFMMPDEDMNIDAMSPWLLRIELDREMMADKRLTMADIATKIQEDFGSDLHIIFNDDNAEKLIVRIRMINSDGLPTEEEPTGEDNRGDLILRNKSELLMEMKLLGISGINRVFMRQDCKPVIDDAGCFTTEREWILDTVGVALKQALHHPDVDPTRTYCNNVVEIVQVLGIEAARKVLLQELISVFAYDGDYINNRHLTLLVDMMTFSGNLTPIGMTHADSGPLVRSSSLGYPSDVFVNAALFSEVDEVKGVTANIMLGKLAKMGTGFFDVYLNHERLS